MNHPEFEVTIGPDGKVRVRVQGVSGPECLEYADLIRDIVGREEQRELTADYYAAPGQVRLDTRVQTRRTP